MMTGITMDCHSLVVGIHRKLDEKASQVHARWSTAHEPIAASETDRRRQWLQQKQSLLPGLSNQSRLLRFWNSPLARFSRLLL